MPVFAEVVSQSDFVDFEGEHRDNFGLAFFVVDSFSDGLLVL